MKILYVWNTCGIGSTLAKFHKINGNEAKVLKCKGYDDHLDVGEFKDIRKSIFVHYALAEARKYDLIVVVAADKMVPRLKRLYPKKEVRLIYCGSDIRARWEEKSQYWKYADKIYLIHRDTLPEIYVPQAEYLPTPVDVEYLKKSKSYTPNTGLFTKMEYGDQGEAFDLASKISTREGINLTIRDRGSGYMKYSEYIDYLRNFEHYFNIKKYPKNGLMEELDLGGLEALAIGAKVFQNDQVYKGLPKGHNAKKVANKIEKD